MSHPSVAAPRRLFAMITALVVVILASVLTNATPSVHAATGKITICHRTHSVTNPYRRITVNRNAVNTGRHGGHGLPSGSSNPAVFDAGFDYAANNKYWGDVIPGGTNNGSSYGGSSVIALNWTTAGQAVFYGPRCSGMSATEFYDTEIAAGVPESSVIADLNEQGANEDAALLAALGGSFTPGNISQWNTAVSVATDPVTDLTTTTATFHGMLTVGATSTVPGFDYGTDPALASVTSVAANPRPVTDSTAVTAVVTGLTPGTTYRVRVSGTTNIGTENEGILYGTIVTFTTPEESATSTTPEESATSTTVEPATSTTVEPATSTTVEPATSTTVEPATSTTVEPATSTTVEPATTTTVAGARGTIEGRVFVDRDDDAEYGAHDVGLAGVQVWLWPAQTYPQSRSQSVGFLALSLPAAVDSRVTGAGGAYRFDSLDAGEYVVTTAASLAAFRYSFDTDGAQDWIVGVQVHANQVAVAGFAGISTETLSGTVDVASLGADSQLTCTWFGQDGLPGNADDQAIVVPVDAAGHFEATGVPHGQYRCTTATAELMLDSQPVASAPPASNPPQPPAPLAPTLPVTGTSSTATLTLAALAAAAGLALLTLARRRRTSTTR